MHIINSMGDDITQRSAEIYIKNFVDYDIISERDALLLKAAISDKVLSIVPLNVRDNLRAGILKNMLMSLIV